MIGFYEGFSSYFPIDDFDRHKNNVEEIVETKTEIEKKGVSVGVHYRPVHLEPYYANKFPDNIGKFPIAEESLLQPLVA